LFRPKLLAGEQEVFYCNADQFPWLPALKIFVTEPEWQDSWAYLGIQKSPAALRMCVFKSNAWFLGN